MPVRSLLMIFSAISGFFAASATLNPASERLPRFIVSLWQLPQLRLTTVDSDSGEITGVGALASSETGPRYPTNPAPPTKTTAAAEINAFIPRVDVKGGGFRVEGLGSRVEATP